MQLPLAAIDLLTILTPPAPGFHERLAASELRRGLWQLGYRGSLREAASPGPDPRPGELRLLLSAGATAAEGFEIASSVDAGATTVRLAGAGTQGLLYGVFELLERQGAFFGLDGERYPLEPARAVALPEPGQPWAGQPLFATRGLLPWPDFLNGITVYNREDYRAYLEAALRMRVNTVCVHVYGGGGLVEPFLSFELDGVGHSGYLDTSATSRWGWLPQRTSRYGMGAAGYFAGEIFGSAAALEARGPWEAAERAQALLRDALAYAGTLGIATGVGFEPHQVPDEIMRAAPAEARVQLSYDVNGAVHRFVRLHPESRVARDVLEARLAGLLEAYPSVRYVYLWEDEAMSWASQKAEVPLSATSFLQAHAFLRRHAPDKRLVLAGWGGVARTFETFHRLLPDDVIFTCLSDQMGWDPVPEVFARLEGRERWAVPWLEDDASMWFPQPHVSRFARDLPLAEQYGCQGVFGIHWRHRSADPVAGFLARRSWDATLTPARHYAGYARAHAAGERADALAELLLDADVHQRVLSAWTGELRPDGHAALHELAGDYSEAFLFRVELRPDIPDEQLDAQVAVIEQLGALLARAASPEERERLGYLYGQLRFVDPYARAWRVGARLQRILTEQHQRRQQPARADSAQPPEDIVRAQALPLWLELLVHVRAAVLAFQRTIATRGDLGTLASIHNKLVRITTARMRRSLQELLGELPPEAEAAHTAALAPDPTLEAGLFVPTRPTLLEPGATLRLLAVAPGALAPVALVLCTRPLGDSSAWTRCPMELLARRTYGAELSLPAGADGLAYFVEAVFSEPAGPRLVHAPAGAPDHTYMLMRLAVEE